ncbi:MAG: dihydroorotate dehydrogenase electron transfer subunit [Treponema sp.]|jgi:NAD(P)H-flavin reductase|nr:dihydroorotate dehydrogenase electron transfer subunit [Treponema sp.]
MPVKQCLSSRLLNKTFITREIFSLDFSWSGDVPKAGQFFLVKPKRSSVFLGRPVSAALWQKAIKDTGENRRRLRGKSAAHVEFMTNDTVRFLIAYRGKGIEELAKMQVGDEAELIGPLGNCWEDFVKPDKLIALIGGGIGVAPLLAFANELKKYGEEPGQIEGDYTYTPNYSFYAGFRSSSKKGELRFGILDSAELYAGKLILATEDGSEGQKGRIPDFLDPAKYSAVCACGPEPMLKAVAAKCKAAGTPCFISMEKHMACGVGACLGCTVKTVNGNRRCCADGPIFNAEDVIFE